MANKSDLITREVVDLVEPVLEELGYELVDVEYLSNLGRWVLRLYIDKAGGVSINDCARVSGEVGDLIDVKDIIPHEYLLEVSSPGLDRPLKKEKDLLSALGKKVKVKMQVPVKGRRNFTGYLRTFQGGILTLEVGGISVTLPWRDVERANLVYEFDR